MASAEKKIKILFIRFSSLGDIILTTPAVNLARKIWPQADIIYATKKKFADVLNGNEAIDKIVTLNQGESISSLVKKTGKQFDIVIDLHNSARSRFFRFRLSKKMVAVFSKPYLRRLLLVKLKINLMQNVKPVAWRAIDTVKQAARKWDNQETSEIDKYIPEAYVAIENSQSLMPESFARAKGPVVALAPGATWYTKRWPLDKFAQTIQKLDDRLEKFKVIITGGHAEKQIGHKLTETLAARLPHIHIWDACGSLSIAQTAWVLKHSDIVLTNDSGLMHIAAATEVPLVALFLGTTPQLGFIPFTDKCTVIQAEHVSCRPCNHKGLKKCPRRHFHCANDIEPHNVARVMAGQLQNQS